MNTFSAEKGKESVMKLTDYLKIDMKDRIIKNILLPPLSENCQVKTYKV